MNKFFPSFFFIKPQSQQEKLLRLTAIYLFILSLIITFAPIAQSKQFKTDPLNFGQWIGFIVWLVMYSLLNATFKREQIKKDILLLPIVAIMSGWGLLMVWRLAPSLGVKQTVWFTLSTLLIVYTLPHHKKILQELRKHKYIWLIAGLTITALTFIFGTNPTNSGPKLWLGCCGFYIQPAEPLKLLLILYLAAYFADRQPFSKKIMPLITPTVMMAGITLLILIFQRDLGTASIFIFIYASMVYIATSKKRLVIASLLIIGIGVFVGYRLFDVVQLRIEAWINPWADPSGRSYQIVQSLISIAAGGMTGRGPGMGYPNLVPIAFSDFIFSAIAEEFGFPGTIGLILIFILFTFRGLSVAIRSQNRYYRYLSTGLTTYIASQAILIIGGNIRLLPLTGVTLPFFSYGGSSLVTSFMAYFLIIAVNQNTTKMRTIPRQPKPILHLALLLLLGFIGITIVNAWWSIYRAPDLLNRLDNARRAISDQYNERGEILDRNLTPLSFSVGDPGNYQRYYPFPEFSSTIGYTQPFFGQAGMEASLDPVLRGLEFKSPWNIWYYHLLYGQSPPGLDVQLTLDSDLQLLAASRLPQTPGAIILLNATTGQILVLFSNPYYDANQLDEIWETLQNDTNTPLINRATQSLYPPGPILAPFLIAQTTSFGPLPDEITNLQSTVAGTIFDCTTNVSLPATWNQIGRSGCPAPLEQLGQSLGAEGLDNLFTKLGFYEVPDIRLELTAPYIPAGIKNPSISAIGQGDILVSPLQMAFAAATLSNQGNRPTPQLLNAVSESQGNWTQYPSTTDSVRVFTPRTANRTALMLKNETLPFWEASAYAITENGTNLTWYIGGTLPGKDPAYVVAVLLESQNINLAEQIGQMLLTEINRPQD
jgi:cell division protein FtsW (lipid II flippase)/cell division protein FtsI/penicillin-binding protein 2